MDRLRRANVVEEEPGRITQALSVFSGDFDSHLVNDSPHALVKPPMLVDDNPGDDYSTAYKYIYISFICAKMQTLHHHARYTRTRCVLSNEREWRIGL